MVVRLESLNAAEGNYTATLRADTLADLEKVAKAYDPVEKLSVRQIPGEIPEPVSEPITHKVVGVGRVGEICTVAIPQGMARSLGIKPGDGVDIRLARGCIVVRRARKP